MKIFAETILTGVGFTVEMRRPRMGLAGWLAVQLIALAIYVAGPLQVITDEGGEP